MINHRTLGYRAVYLDGESVMLEGSDDARRAWLNDHRIVQIVRVMETYQGIVFHTRAKGVTDADRSDHSSALRRCGTDGDVC